MKRIVLALAFLLGSACPPHAAPVIVPLMGDAGGTVCERACRVLAPCPEGHDSPGGHSCLEVCAALDPAFADCVANVRSEDALHACGVRCVP